MRKRGVWLLSVPFALGLALTACTSGGGADPTFSPTDTYTPPSHSTSPDPSTTAPVTTGPNVRPGEKPPTLPPVAKTNSNAGAIAFAEYWERTIDWGYATVDSSLARSAFSPACAECTRFMKSVFDSAHANGTRFGGGRFQIRGAILQRNDHHNGATDVVDVTYAVQALQVSDRTGKTLGIVPADDHIIDRVWMRWLGGRLTVVDWKKVSYK
jgi:hypothetical protein